MTPATISKLPIAERLKLAKALLESIPDVPGCDMTVELDKAQHWVELAEYEYESRDVQPLNAGRWPNGISGLAGERYEERPA